MAFRTTITVPVLVSSGARSLTDLESTFEAAPTITNVERIPGDTETPCLGLAFLRVTGEGEGVTSELADFASLMDLLAMYATEWVRDFTSYGQDYEQIEI